jgi:hypothetical protein
LRDIKEREKKFHMEHLIRSNYSQNQPCDDAGGSALVIDSPVFNFSNTLLFFVPDLFLNLT